MDPIEPGDMLIDDYDVVDEKQDVAIITPDDSADEPDPEPLADDYTAMKARILPQLPDLEIEAEAVHTWNIENYRSLGRKARGPVFQCGGHPWRVLFFPSGNNVEFASFYLEQGFEGDKPPDDWYACVQFVLVLWNKNDPSIYVHHTANHRYNGDEGDWGFTRFAELRKLFAAQWEGKGRPMVENEAVNVTAYVRIYKDPTGVLWHNFINYDSKKETGMVGLKNQGATCYLNSLLQSLYFTNAFRKAVYQIPTEHEADRANSAWALQRLFYLLQTNDTAVSTQELTASFGWETRHIFEQQDVQELSRILMERMEERMKGTKAENALAKMFVGKMKTYISCINVDYESSRIEDFWDIQLNVSGNKNLDESFRDYVQVETMDGENKYFAEGYGLQDAKKGVIFESFPQVLHLQLKRFEYDFNRDAMMKINDRYEFPEVFDAAPYLSADADKSEPYTYQLHGVLVHSGDLNAGHYYAYLKPTKDGHFYKFDDDRVTRATPKEALEENFGGDYTNMVNGNSGIRNPYTRTLSTKRSMSAYMLVYIRQSRLDDILLKVAETDTPSHLAKQLNEEKATIERKRKEREEQHLYMQMGVVTDENFKAFQGFDLCAWEGIEPGTEAAPKTYRILRTSTVADFVRTVAAEKKLPAEQVRLWVMVNRQNKTTRPDQPIETPEMTIDEAFGKYGSRDKAFRFWLEVAKNVEDGKPVWPDAPALDRSNAPILIFLKYFDADTQSLKGVGHIYAKKHSKVGDMAPSILQLMGWSPGATTAPTLALYEEIKHSMIEPMKSKATLQQAEIQDGDIICFQKVLSEKEVVALQQSGAYIDAREFYDHLLNRVTIQFNPKVPNNTDGDCFSLVLSKRMSYDQFSAKVGERLGVDPTHIRFSTVNSTSGKPKQIVKRNPNQNLWQVLSPQFSTYNNSNQRNDALYYEVLDMSLSELDTKKVLKVTWVSEGVTKEETFDILVAKNGVVADLLPGLQKKAGLDDETIQNIRIFEAHAGKFYKQLGGEYSVASITEFVVLYAERIPEEEQSAEEGDKVISVFHFDKETNKPHGVPFKFLVKPGETFQDTKQRLSKRTGIKGKQFDKIKFALVQRQNYSKPLYLTDEDVLADIYSAHDDLLGLDHTVMAPHVTLAMAINVEADMINQVSIVPDPVSIVSLLAIGLHSANKLLTLVEGVRDAPREIQNISNQSRSICDILSTLNEYLEENRDSQLPTEITQSLHIPLANTCRAADELVDKIKPFVKEKSESKTSRWVAGMRWSFSQEDVKQLGEQLSNGKSTLSMTLAVVNVIKTSHIKNDTTEIIQYLKKLNLEPKMAQGSPEGHGTSNQAGVEGFDSRIKDVNFAMTRFLETASTAIESPTHSPWASPTDIAQASTFDGNLNYNDDSDLDRSPTLAKQDYEPEIQHMLAQERAHTFTNEDGQTALHLAAKQDAYLTRNVLSHSFDINLRNIDGETPLMCAVSAGNVDTVTLLLKNHADVNEVDDQRATCLHLAALKDESGSMTQLLLRRNPNIETMDAIGLTPLFLAAFNGNDAVVHQLLKFGAKLEAKELDGFNALHYACMQANHGFMSRLLDKSGPDFEAFYELSTYGLPADSSHSTISKRRAQIVRSLLAHSADVHASSKGFTPLHIATLTAQEQVVNILLSNDARATGIPVITAYWGLTPEIVDLLLTRGANISATDSRWNKPALTWTAEIGSPTTLKVLLSHGANVHHQDNQGSSALHYAGANARNESVTLLLDAGADPNLLDSGGNTPLIRLARAGRFYLAGRWWNPSAAERGKTATLLLNAGCDPSVRNRDGNLAVHYAAGNGYRGVLEAIEKVGGDVELPDGSGRTAEEWAKEKGEMEVVKFLKRKRTMRGKGGGET